MGNDGLPEITRGSPRTETIDLRDSSTLVLSIPLSHAPDARWMHQFRLAVGVDSAIGTKAPPIVGQTVIVETTEVDAGRAVRMVDERIEAANRAYRLNQSVDLVVEELEPDAEQLSVLDRLLGD